MEPISPKPLQRQEEQGGNTIGRELFLSADEEQKIPERMMDDIEEEEGESQCDLIFNAPCKQNATSLPFS